MRKEKIIFIISIFLLCFLYSVNGEERQIEAIWTDVRPIIDGKLEGCWQKAAKAENFYDCSELKLADVQTTAYLLYDDKALYIAFYCDEPNINEINRILSYKTRDSRIWENECVEIFLSPYSNGSPYFHFITNVAGTKYDALGTESSWNYLWEVATSIGKDYWVAEFCIPFSSLNLSSDTNQVWRINFNRERNISCENSAWSCTFSQFHNPEKFGVLRGLKFPAPTIHIVSLDERIVWGKNKFKAIIENESQDDWSGVAYLRIEDEERNFPITLAKEQVNIPGKTIKEIQLEKYTRQKDGRNIVSLTLEDANGEVIVSASRTLPIIPLFLQKFFILYKGEEDLSFEVTAPEMISSANFYIQQGKKRVMEKKVKFSTSGKEPTIVAIPTKGLECGCYSCKIDVFFLQEKTAETLNFNFEIIPGIF
ncbi:MAG TPA: carbohydrate binding family 9 domain-containing protein [Candidatus Ratteibacteria bacterium]|nr:carbohydrate binding family 9 domain-containing protein [Candidatus Ratteibacteria bacterium]